MAKTTSFEPDETRHLPLLSFTPLINYFKKKQFDKHNTCDGCSDSIDKILFDCDFTLSIEDLDGVNKQDPFINEMIKILFNESDPFLDMYAITAPCSDKIIFSSNRYKTSFLASKNNSSVALNLTKANIEIVYQLILQKFYGLELIHNNTYLSPVTNEISGSKRFVEFELVADFVEISVRNKLPAMDPADLSRFFNQVKYNKFLEDALPLHLFLIEGIVIIKMRDVTMRESLNVIKNTLLTMPYLGDVQSFEKLKRQIQNLIELPEADITLTSVITNNDDEADPNIFYSNNLLMHPVNLISNRSPVWLELKEVFKERNSFVISNLLKSPSYQFNFLQCYVNSGAKSVALFPLKFGKELIGILSIVAKKTDSILQYQVISIEPVIPLLALALEKQSERMDDEIDKVIKEQFTAVQSSVNWKFTAAARNFIIQKNKGGDSKIESIVFEDVFPLYGSIDVRNSSIERRTAIQKDLLEQLQLAYDIIKKSKKEVYLFSLQEISYRIDKYITITSIALFPADELAIQNFLDDEITALFSHLKKSVPAVSNDIDNYFFLLNTNTNKISKQCAAFEESITRINNELIKFINQEQAKVQEIYAHYFEYFVTDGVDFNIYIGQSITPGKPFDQFYLKNLKLWQLTTLVRASQKIRNLRDSIPVPLDTTQLILAHSKPLSISFRVAERKFDVDGAYNIHYEIIKKRIDKVKIMGSSERLTQPGTIAIVFAHDKEAEEYTSYIKYLQQEGLLEEAIEYFDLEELQGVRGLKALRVAIKMDVKEEEIATFVDNYQLKTVRLPGCFI